MFSVLKGKNRRVARLCRCFAAIVGYSRMSSRRVVGRCGQSLS